MLTRMADRAPARVLFYAIAVDVAAMILLVALFVRTIKENNPQLYASAPNVPTTLAASSAIGRKQPTTAHLATVASLSKTVAARTHSIVAGLPGQRTTGTSRTVAASTPRDQRSHLPAPLAPPLPVLLAQQIAQVQQRVRLVTKPPLHAVFVHRSSTHLRRSGTVIVYVAIGASDTVGIGATDPDTQGWVADVSRTLPTGSTTINLGRSGILLHDILSQELPRAIAAHPDLITIWTAVNDFNSRVSLGAYRRDLRYLVTTLRRTTHARIYVGNVPELSLVPIYASVPAATVRAEVAAWNAAIAHDVRATGGVLVDLHAPSLATLPRHPEYISGDNFHPSAAGYSDIARTFERVINHDFHVVMTPATTQPTALLSIGRATLAPAAARIALAPAPQVSHVLPPLRTSNVTRRRLHPATPPTPAARATTNRDMARLAPLVPPTPVAARK